MVYKINGKARAQRCFEFYLQISPEESLCFTCFAYLIHHENIRKSLPSAKISSPDEIIIYPIFSTTSRPTGSITFKNQFV